jgi:beta-lactamase superfamily II metal-dependent hydrolase
VGTLGVYCLDVGQGDCSLIFPPEGGAPILFDCADAYVTERFLEASNLKRLTAVVVSHLDEDHIGGMLTFLEAFVGAGGQIGTLYLGMDRPAGKLQEGAKRQLLKRAIEWARNKVLAIAPPMRDRGPKIIHQGQGWKVRIVLPFPEEVLAAQLDQRDEPNRSAVVLRVDRGPSSVLIGSDAPLVCWEQLEPNLLQADGFRIPHHGGGIEEGRPTWTRKELYTRVNARLAVCSVGTRNAYKHPYEDHLLDARRAGACRLVCTQLTARCHKDPLALRDESLKNQGNVFYPFRHRLLKGEHRPDQEVPCAGTILVDLDEQGAINVTPAPQSWHDTLVDKMNTPLCRRV